MLVGTLYGNAGTFPGKEGGMQMLAGLALFSHTVISLFWVTREQVQQSSQMTRGI
jgi:hypothetical protein